MLKEVFLYAMQVLIPGLPGQCPGVQEIQKDILYSPFYIVTHRSFKSQ